jgi:crotonobetainyl-CoA:carnitine CoA-transferase CaiB-like acyl-CoA transferase
MNSKQQNFGPLDGVKVVEMGQLIAGPFCGELLGDIGKDPDLGPSRMGVFIGDSLAATFGCLGALALHHRDKTGEGQVIDSSLYDYLIGANQDGVLTRLCAAMGRPELATDPRYVDHEQRGHHQQELDALIEAWTRTLAAEELEAAMIEAAAPASKMYRAPEMLEDPHFKAREAIVEVDHPRWGKLPMQNAYPKFSKTPGSLRRTASQAIGEDNAEVYRQRLGLRPENLDALKTAGVI